MTIYQELYLLQPQQMEIRAIGYDKLIGLESELEEVIDTSFKFYDLGDLHRRFNS